MASLVAPTAAEAAPRGPQPVSNFVQRVRAHTDTWVSIRWQTDRRICDAQVWVSGRRVDVDYPRNARSTSFSRGDSLRPGRTDFTAFRVNADFDRSGVALLRATLVYDNCGRFDRPVRRSFGIAMPVVAYRPGNGGPIGGGNGHGNGNNGGGNNGHQGGNNGHQGGNNGHQGGNNGHQGGNNGHQGGNNGGTTGGGTTGGGTTGGGTTGGGTTGGGTTGGGTTGGGTTGGGTTGGGTTGGGTTGGGTTGGGSHGGGHH
ncbi:hypothetical protein ACQP2Y_06910 [Actinoplanes sp. CA-051413]|uniref:hypothetical protein n=1 Tax=Actinoplanes sp. CA-051413 TaxID=3239899 RepID=UPI003D971594